jgi:iron complex outermembrane recepter protein
VGLKSQWLADRSLLNVAAFRSDYRDLQIASVILQANGQQAAAAFNAASSRAEGLELESQWVPVHELSLTANITYLHSRYLRFPGASASIFQAVQGISTQDLSGRPTEYAPDWSGTLIARVTLPLPHELEFVGEASPYYTTGYYIHDSDEPFFLQGGYLRLDSRLSLQTASGRWALDVIGKNLTDRNIMLGVAGYYNVWKAPRRSVAAQVRYRW